MTSKDRQQIISRRNALSFLGAVGAGLLGCDDPNSAPGGASGSSGTSGSSGSSGGPGFDGGPGDPNNPNNPGAAGPGDGGTFADGEAGAGPGPKIDAGASSGTIGSWANLNLQQHPIYSIDMSLRDYPQWSAHPDSGEVRVHEVGTWWDGGDALRTHPPTTAERGSGIGSLTNLWRNGTLAIRELNFRFEWTAGPQYCSRTNGNLPKFVIVHAVNSLNTNAPIAARPMLFLAEMFEPDNAAHRRADTLTICPAQGTVRSFSLDPYSENGTTYANQIQPVYWADTAATFNGRPVIGAGEIVTFEMRMLAISTATHPRGLIGVRIYRRNGMVYERGCPWNWDTNVALNVSYLQEIQMFGGGYYNNANPANANNYTKVGGLITLAANYGGWLGPRAGFVL